jgi:hypothetical protein
VPWLRHGVPFFHPDRDFIVLAKGVKKIMIPYSMISAKIKDFIESNFICNICELGIGRTIEFSKQFVATRVVMIRIKLSQSCQQIIHIKGLIYID